MSKGNMLLIAALVSCIGASESQAQQCCTVTRKTTLYTPLPPVGGRTQQRQLCLQAGDRLTPVEFRGRWMWGTGYLSFGSEGDVKGWVRSGDVRCDPASCPVTFESRRLVEGPCH
jgi:hypothetical protein